jgi:hypothetical protein
VTGYCAAPGCAPYKPRHTDAIICDWCTKRVGDALDALPGHYRELQRELPRSTSRHELVSGSRTPQPPLRVDIIDTMADTAKILARWEDLTRAEFGYSPRRTDVREQVAVARACRFLRGQLGRVLGEPDLAGAFARNTLDCRARLGTMLGWNELRHRLPAPCPACSERALLRYSGDSYVRCVACRSAWHESEYAHLILVLTEEARHVSTGG